jgi:hypothetical protein
MCLPIRCRYFKGTASDDELRRFHVSFMGGEYGIPHLAALPEELFSQE